MSDLTEKQRKVKKLGENTSFLLELFDARKRLKTETMVNIFESHAVVHQSLTVLKRRGLVENVDRGVWELVE